MHRRELLTWSCAAASTVAVSGVGSAESRSGDLTIEVVRHGSVRPSDQALHVVLEGVELFAETWTDATPGSATV
ncbi:hypothetical protein [Natrinema caseinilyticum]|uniref:hypothetical protein n=1 Tax=Natrinema caseinilyticum TaxID=2961570 RepID=UPI0020C5B092|nr:hypothetical protein [Natrinema caseinilyticum]